MYDDFDDRNNRDRMERILERLRDLRVWKRVAQTVFFGLLIWVVGTVLYVAAGLQIVHGLVTGRPIAHLLPFGRWLGAYLRKMALFMAWSIDQAPFPFSPLAAIMDEDIVYRDEEAAGGDYDSPDDDFEPGSPDEPFADEQDEAWPEAADDAPPPERDNEENPENEGGQAADPEKNEDGEEDRPAGKQPPRPDA